MADMTHVSVDEELNAAADAVDKAIMEAMGKRMTTRELREASK